MRARTSTPDDAKRVTMQVSTAGIVCNAALTVFKLVAGIVAHSSAIVADAVHSASDILGSLIVMIGAVFSHKAADASHPYGHEKLECIASILLGNILVVVGAAIGYAGVMKIIRGEKGPFVAMPQYKDSHGDYHDICFPCTKEARQQFNDAVLNAYEQSLRQDQQQDNAPPMEQSM